MAEINGPCERNCSTTKSDMVHPGTEYITILHLDENCYVRLDERHNHERAVAVGVDWIRPDAVQGEGSARQAAGRTKRNSSDRANRKRRNAGGGDEQTISKFNT